MYPEKITNPFLCMNIVCPPGSYDANVEPAKDDVLFVDQTRLLLMLETFFKSIYGELEATGGKKVQKTKSQREPKDQKGFDLLLARKPQSIECCVSPSTDITTTEIVGDADHRSSTGGEGQLQVDADEAVEQDKVWTEKHQLPTGPVGPSQFERAGRNSLESQSPEHSPGDHNAADGERLSKGKSTWHFSMYGGDEEHVEELDKMSIQPTEDHVVDRAELEDINVSNPWTTAKMNSFARSGRRTEPRCANESILDNNQLMTPAREGKRTRTSTIVPSNEIVHREGAIIANFQIPQHALRSPSPSPKAVSSSGVWHFPSKAWGKAPSDPRNDKTKARALERDGEGALDAWIRSSPSTGQPAEGIEDRHLTRGLVGANRINVLDASQRSHANPNDFISARSLQQGTQLCDIPEAPSKRTPELGLRKQHGQAAIHKPFVSPVNDPTKVWFEMEPQRRPRPHAQAQSRNVQHPLATTAPIRYQSETEGAVEETSLLNPTPLLSAPTQLDLEDLMDYEHRKLAATRAYKLSLHNQTNMGLAIPNSDRVDRDRVSSANSPHKNRYEAAKAALTPSTDNAGSNKTMPSIFADGDPRAYLIRVQKREEEAAQRDSVAAGGHSHKLRRARTAMLPLETIAADRRVHNLVFNISTDVTSVKKREGQIMGIDEYVRRGEITCGLLAISSDDEVHTWERKVSDILKTTYRDAGNGDGKEELSFDLSPALRHLAAYT